MVAKLHAEGFEVSRLHSDRGREFHNTQMKAWCAKHKIHRTLAIPEEHQGNGRAEGAILRMKTKTRTLLQSAELGPEEWPLAARQASHAMQNQARLRMGMIPKPSIPFNAKVQVLQRSWKRGVWESLTTTATTRGPSGDSTRGWIVKLQDGGLLTTGKVFPAVDVDKALDIRYKGDPVEVSVPERRVRGKTTVKSLEASFDHSDLAAATSGMYSAEDQARYQLEHGNFTLQAVQDIIGQAKCDMPSESKKVAGVCGHENDL